MGWLPEAILRILRAQNGRSLTCFELSCAIYGGAELGSEDCIRVTISRMRRQGYFKDVEKVSGYRIRA